MDFDDLVRCSCNVYLKLSSFIERTIEKSKQALVSNIRAILCRVFLQFIGDVVGVVIAIEEYVLILF